MAITAAMRTQVTELYVSLFGRAPERDGLAFWVGKLDAGATYAQIAQQMFDVEPARAYYPKSSTNRELVEKFYSNVLGRTADKEGVDFWTSKFDAAGKVTVGDVFAQIIAAVKGYTGTDQAALDSKALFLNKVAVGEYYGFTLNSNDIAGAKAIMANVTKDPASVEAAKQTNGNDPVLTNDTDVVSGVNFTANLVYTPGGDDRVNSLQDEDVLTGTSAKNTLTATLGNSNDNGATTVTPTLNNIDVINVAFTGSGDGAVQNLDLQDATRVSEVNISRVASTSNIARVENVQSVLSKMSVKNSNANNAGTIEFSFGTDVLKGDNAGTLEVSNVQVATINVGQNTSGTGASGVGANSYETLTLNSVGSSNRVGTLNLPMDTGTAGKVVITGDKNLNLSTATTINSASVTTNIEATNFSGGIAGANGRLAAIDASAFTGNLTLNIGNGTFTTGKADTSGVVQNVTITGGKGNDTFYLADTIQTGDSLTGGDGTDTLTIVNGGNITSGATGSSIVTKVEALNVFMNGASSSVDFDKLPDVTGVTVRNIGNNGTSGATAADVAFTLNNLTVAQATAITVLHSTTGNGDVTQTTLSANLKSSSGTADTVAVTLLDGVNTDGKFNLTLNASGAENLTINNNDSESNIVELGTNSSHTGTITVKGTTAGTSINFDVDTAAAAGATTGLLRQNVGQGSNGSGAVDVGTLSTQVRIGAATFDASAEAANVIARFNTNAASAVGAQKITTGSGNDTVIFDALDDNRAGLTISDTVDGGTGTDTLVIDGNLSVAGVIALGASEWTNVSNFETIRLVNAGAGSSYSLTLTDTLISKNNASGVLTITNDNDTANDSAATADTAGVSNESAVVIDARSLNNTSRFNYNGEEGASRTTDRIIMSDVNLNGTHGINGGAVDNSSTTFAANADILEIRNTAVATLGDLANIRNMGNIHFNNDQAVAQTLTLQLDGATVDALADSFHTSSAAERETLTIKANDGSFTAVAAAQLDIDATLLGDLVNLNITGDTGLNGNDIVRLTASAAAGAQTINLGAGTSDKISFAGGSNITITGTAGGNITMTQGANSVTHVLSNYEQLDLTGFTGTAVTLTAAAGGSTIMGSSLNESLTFAGGTDTLVLRGLTVALNGTDTIASFTAGTDKVQVNLAALNAATGASLTAGGLAGANFATGAGLTSAAGAGVYFVFDTTTKTLYFDADANGAGTGVALVVTTAVNLTNADITLA